MTPEWFEDLAERLSDASQFACFDDEESLARDFQMACQSALDYAYRIRKAIEETGAAAEPPPGIESVRRSTRAGRSGTRVA